MKIIKNIQPILNITKNVIKKSDNFNDYYFHEDNNLFKNQLPLLMHRSRIREVMLFKKLKREDIVVNEEQIKKEEEKKRNFSNILLSNIRKAHERSKKLPPLCPFYSRKGELLPEVVSTSKVSCRNMSQTEGNYNININSSNYFGILSNRSYFGSFSPINIKKGNNFNFYKNVEINFEDFQKEILFESKYNSLKYDISEIYGHKDFYQEFISGLVDEILILTNEENQNENNDFKENNVIKKEKIFESGKNKRKIVLTLNSINIKIKEVTKKDLNKKEENKNRAKDKNCFEYNLPINLIPLFYYKGYEKFKLFILSFIRWNEESEKFEINENISKIINNLLTNCKDLKKVNEEDLDIDDMNLTQPVEIKKNMTLKNKLNFGKLERKSSKNYSNYNNLMARTLNTGVAMQNQLFAGTNVDIVGKKKMKKSKFKLYPKEKKNSDFINYNIFEFFWNISNKIFLVTVESPLITFNIPSYNNIVKQFINYELLFYLFKINFDSWDFYVIKYLSSLKNFRTFLSQLASIKPKKNINYFLEKYKKKSFEYTDCKIINVCSSKLLGEIDNNQEKKNKNLNRRYSITNNLEKIEENKEEKAEGNKSQKKEDIKTENKDNKNEEETKKNDIKDKDKEKKKEVLPTEETNQTNSTNQLPLHNNNDITTDSNININNNILRNYIIEQKCFIAIVTFNDTEKSISNQYTIHFDYSHFTKFKSMEKHMKKTSFLLKFIDISYENSTIKFDYDSLNAFNEKKWMHELEKYNLKYEERPITEHNNTNKEEAKIGTNVVVNKNKAEYAGSLKGTSIIIDIREPIILLRYIGKNGEISTQRYEILEEEETKLCLNKDIKVEDLASNLFEICLEHKRNELEEKKNKELADNIIKYNESSTKNKSVSNR